MEAVDTLLVHLSPCPSGQGDSASMQKGEVMAMGRANPVVLPWYRMNSSASFCDLPLAKIKYLDFISLVFCC